ncbi:MAG: glycine cleavage system H-protein subunit [Watsoniomyces obsoletus]|nr:MAG: glycine cleavage system H-protein subunit [Watsoniomyces obsoletus]
MWTQLKITVLEKKYTEDHEWVELSGDGKTGTMGITEYAAKQLGDVVFVELPELGLEVNKGDPIGAVESVKSASDIMTPVTGRVVDHNKLLEEKPGQVNKSPEGDAWLAKIEIADSTELDSLMDRDGYTAFTEEQAE